MRFIEVVEVFMEDSPRKVILALDRISLIIPDCITPSPSALIQYDGQKQYITTQESYESLWKRLREIDKD